MSYEIVLQVRNAKGEPTGKTKSFQCEEASQLAAFYYKHSTPTTKKVKK